MNDRYGKKVKAGDTVHSSYGIPPVVIEGKVVDREGVLWVLCPGHTPDECKLTAFKRYLGGFEVLNEEE